MNLKVKVWIEDKNNNLLFGGGKTQVLKHLDTTGSIIETAKQNDMTYDKVMKHIEVLDNNVEEEMVLRLGGRNEDSVNTYMLSADARMVLQAYEILQYDVEKYARKRFKELY